MDYQNGHSLEAYFNPSASLPTDSRMFAPQTFPYNYENFSYDLSVPVPASMELKTDDELFVETWLSKIGKISINLDSSLEVNTKVQKLKVQGKPAIKLHVVKNSLKKVLDIIEKLECTQKYLKENLAKISTDEWKEKTIEIGELKDELSKLMSQFQNLEALKKVVQKRAKKRLNQRNRKLENKLFKEQEEENCKKMHKQIDQWLENMKDSVERVKAEENMKKDADCVLAEVTKKKSDARKQLMLISALLKLRNVRETVAVQRGEKVSVENREAFTKTAEDLTKMWENSLRTYGKEEQGLRIMLEQSASDGTKQGNLNKEKLIAYEWEKVLFGNQNIPTTPIYWNLTSAERDFETFVAIRKSWDTFLSKDGNDGSKIPIGWVLPSTNANDNWTKYLKN